MKLRIIKQLLLTSVGMLLFITVHAQDNLTEMEYSAYLRNSKSLWKTAVQKRKEEYESSNSNQDLFRLASAQQGLLNVTMTDQDEELFDDHVDDTKDNMKKLIDNDFKVAESKALLSSVYGYEMAYSSWKGMFLGSKSSSAIARAIELNDQSPLVWQVQGSSKLFTPSMFGGDKTEALNAFKKSVELYEKNGDTDFNWRYLDALAWLGQAYKANGDVKNAQATFEKALTIEPEFGWVKNSLLPQLASK